MSKTFEIIAETAFSHEGDVDYLLEQVKAAHRAKADYVKFQVLLEADSYFTGGHPSYELINKWAISAKNWERVFRKARSLGLKIIVLPLNTASLQFCELYASWISSYEIHSVCLKEFHLLKEMRKLKGQVILGIGGRVPQEINHAVKTIGKTSKDFMLMFGFQSFPTEVTQAELGKIAVLRKVFPFACGYADHTSFADPYFIQMNAHAYVLGATFFEKHIVLKAGDKRVDYESGIEFSSFLEMREALEKLQMILGQGKVDRLNVKELAYRQREKQIVAARDIPLGRKITWSDLTYKVVPPRSAVEKGRLDRIVGYRAKRNISKDRVIVSTHLERT